MGGGYVLPQRLAVAKELGQPGGAAASRIFGGPGMYFIGTVKAHMRI